MKRIKHILIILATSLIMFSCVNYPPSYNIEKIEKGMTVENATMLMGLREDEWDEFNGGTNYKYGVNFKTPGGGIDTFWIVVENGIVINIYSV